MVLLYRISENLEGGLQALIRTRTNRMREVTITVFGGAPGLAQDIAMLISEHRHIICMNVMIETGMCTSFSILPSGTGRSRNDFTTWSMHMVDSNNMLVLEVLQYIRGRLRFLGIPASMSVCGLPILTEKAREEARLRMIAIDGFKVFNSLHREAFDEFMDVLR